MPLLNRAKIDQLLQVLKQENSRSLHLSCLPGDFNRARNRLDIARMAAFHPAFPAEFMEALMTGKSVAYRPNQEDIELITSELKVRKKLSHLVDECATEEKERGYSPLRIGYPILVQENNSASTQCYSAPLFIWDIELREDRNGWTFTPSSEVPRRNASLEGLVSARTTELVLEPLYGGSWEEGSLEDFAAGFDDRIQSFLAVNEKVRLMRADDEGPRRFPHIKKADLVTPEARPFRLTLHPSLVLGKFREGKASIIRDLEAHGDALEDLSETPLDTPAMGANLADPSQAGAIADLKLGKHIVLHGPPGTGKSQTITGVITSAISSGYRVAVVCQKLAALEVIEENLKELGHTDGIAKITNLSKDRRKVVDQVRARHDDRPIGLNGPLRVSTAAYDRCSKRILKAKAKAEVPVLGEDRFRDIVGRLGKLRREMEAKNMVNTLRKSPSPEQLSVWLNDLPGTLRTVRSLEEQGDEIADALPLYDFLTEEVRTASIGVDIDLIRDRIAENVKLQTEFQTKEAELRSGLKASFEEKTEQHRSASTAWRQVGTTLDAMPRQVRPATFGTQPLKREIEDVAARMATVGELEEERYRLERDVLFSTYQGARGFNAWWKRTFSAPFKDFHKRWTAHEDKLRSVHLIASDPLPELLGHMKRFHQALRESETVLSSVPGWSELQTPEEVLDQWKSGIEALGQAAKEPLLHPDQPGFEGETRALQTLSRERDALQSHLGRFAWLSRKGAHRLTSEKGEETLTQLASQATRLGPMHTWMSQCKALKLSAKDFITSPSMWMEYHALRSLLSDWSGLKDMLDSDQPIAEVAREVSALRDRINQAVGNIIQHQFMNGAQEITEDHRVHSFKQEFLKTGKRKKTLRQLYHRHGATMTRLFPVHLTTPEVLCNLFEGKDRCFDLVIFDEASQVELHDAVTCLLKGTSIVVAGDEHQMPPSHYFASRTDHLYDDEEEEEEGAIIEVESLLEFCQQHPGFSSRFLDFHYRSHHPLLIQFSNKAIYSRLVVKPNPVDYVPIQFIDVQGVWDNQHNSKEAEKVIDILRTLPRTLETPKILVATLNVRQRTEILRMLRDAETADPSFQRNMEAYKQAGFGVKNLENLQGDECDLLIISIGYGAKPGGRFSRNYGVINQKHGYRLLNVLITRARRKVFLLNSIPPSAHSSFESELAVASTWNRGLLHAYVHYAEAVESGNTERIRHILDILSRFSRSEVREATSASGFLESPFEEEVYHALREHFTEEEITLQEPHLGFRMDMVLRPKSKPGLKIAIECDGATYHSGWENQLADHHREQLLRGAGYAFIRIWSRSWWSDSKQSARDLVAEINKTIRDSDSSLRRQNIQSWCNPLAIEQQASPIRTVTIEPDRTDPPRRIPESSDSVTPQITQTPPTRQTGEPLQKEDAPPPSHASDARQVPTPLNPTEASDNRTGDVGFNEDRRQIQTALHVLAPCMTTVKVKSGNQQGRSIKFIFLESEGRSFLGKSRDQWMRLGKMASNLTVLGSESDFYIAFESAEVGDTVKVNGNTFEIEAIELDD